MTAAKAPIDRDELALAFHALHGIILALDMLDNVQPGDANTRASLLIAAKRVAADTVDRL